MTLPQGWAWTTLGEVCLPPQYGWTTSASADGKLHLPRTTDITSGKIDWESVPFCSDEPPDKGKYLLQDGDVVISRAGSVGYSHLVKNPRPAVFASYLIRFKPLIDEHYFAYFLQSPSYWDSISEKSLGIAIPNVNASKLRQIALPLAPSSEQHRIVAEIEEQLTRLDAGVAALKRAQANLKRYKASVLKAACEGGLVPQDPKDEPASLLLERILAERRKKWEEDLRAKGKDPSKAKYVEPMLPDANGLPELPESWHWASVEQSASYQPRSIQSGPFGSELHHSAFQDSGVLAIGIDNVLEGQFSSGRGHRISPEKFEKLRKFSARPLDVLITVMATVGRCCVVPVELEPAIITKHVYRISANPAFMNPYYLMHSLLSFNVRQQILERVQGQTRPGINGEILKGIAIPVPPLAEQRRIVAEVERRLSVVQEVEAVVATNLARAERLRQSILKQAFEGKLVPQDPNDEPASVLLERIKVGATLVVAPRRGQASPRRVGR